MPSAIVCAHMEALVKLLPEISLEMILASVSSESALSFVSRCEFKVFQRVKITLGGCDGQGTLGSSEHKI